MFLNALYSPGASSEYVSKGRCADRPVFDINGLLALRLVTHFRFEILWLSYFQLCIFSVCCNHLVDLNA